MNVKTNSCNHDNCVFVRKAEFLDRLSGLWHEMPLYQKVAAVGVALLIGVAIAAAIVFGVGPEKIAHFLSQPPVIAGELCLGTWLVWADIPWPQKKWTELPNIEETRVEETVNPLEGDNYFDNNTDYYCPPNRSPEESSGSENDDKIDLSI